MRAGNGCDSHVLFDTLKTEYFKRERAKRNLQRLMATFLLSATISIPFLLSYYIDEYYLSSDNILSDDMLDDTVIYGIGKHSVVTKSTKEELTNALCYLTLEEENESKTKMVYKKMNDKEEHTEIIDGSLWKLDKFMEAL